MKWKSISIRSEHAVSAFRLVNDHITRQVERVRYERMTNSFMAENQCELWGYMWARRPRVNMASREEFSIQQFHFIIYAFISSFIVLNVHHMRLTIFLPLYHISSAKQYRSARFICCRYEIRCVAACSELCCFRTIK